MLTEEVFWNQIGSFNIKFFYLHIIWIAISIVILLALYTEKGDRLNDIVKIFLSLTFLFNSIVFFGLFTEGLVSRYIYGGIFLGVGISFFYDLFNREIKFIWPKRKYIKITTIIGLVLVYAYPFLGVLLGRNFPYICMPMNPCPSTVLAIVLVIAALPKTNKTTLILLLPWALLGLPKAFGLFGCYEDIILFLAGLYGLVNLLVYWKIIGKEKNVEESNFI